MKPPKSTSQSRRTFFRRTWTWLAALAGLELTAAGITFFGAGRKKQEKKEEAGTFSPIISLDDIPAGGAYLLPATRLALTRPDPSHLVALSLRCTHLGCSIEWDDDKKEFHCPCHHSMFNIHGDVLNPPATRPLDLYPLEIRAGEVYVDLSHPIPRDHADPSQETHV